MKGDSYIQKANGSLVLFNREKLVGSLVRSGAKENQANSIADEIEINLVHGMKTQKIYQKAFKLLRSGNRPAASNYQLRRAVMDLGPSGYPFEHLVSAIFRHQGYEVKTGVIMQGMCVTHEVDVFAENKHEVRFIECKFHNQPGVKSDVKIAMYVNSRVIDLKKRWLKDHPDEKRTITGGLVTNTKLTEDARIFASCSGIMGIGWDTPHKIALLDKLTEMRLLPITLIPSLTKREREEIVKEGIVLCRELVNAEDQLKNTLIERYRIEKLIAEAKEVMNHFEL
jgi:predicted RecB family endonuclease